MPAPWVDREQPMEDLSSDNDANRGVLAKKWRTPSSKDKTIAIVGSNKKPSRKPLSAQSVIVHTETTIVLVTTVTQTKSLVVTAHT